MKILLSLIAIAAAFFYAHHALNDWKSDISRANSQVKEAEERVNQHQGEIYQFERRQVALEDIEFCERFIDASLKLDDLLQHKPFGFPLSASETEMLTDGSSTRKHAEERIASDRALMNKWANEEKMQAEEEAKQKLAQEEADRAARVEASKPGAWMYQPRRTSLDR